MLKDAHPPRGLPDTFRRWFKMCSSPREEEDWDGRENRHCGVTGAPGADPAKLLRTPAELKEIIMAERTGYAFLVWRASAAGPQRLLLLEPDRWRVTIGRDPAADVAIAWDAEVSRTHVLLERVGPGWTAVDDGLSRNGSFVNGSRVVGRCRLADHDRLRVGSTEITYRQSAVVAAESTAAVSAGVPVLPLSPTQRKVLIALSRPVHDGRAPIPATNREVADEVFLTVDAVKSHLRVLYGRYGLSDLPQNEKRARLVATALASGVLDPREFSP
jgi:FHA domain